MDKNGILRALITHYTSGNKSQFAKILGIKPQTINTWDARGTFDLELIYSKCEGISAEWLLTGEGPMLKTSTPNLDGASSMPPKVERKKERKENNDSFFQSFVEKQTAAHRQEIREKDAIIEQKNQEINALNRQIGRLEGELNLYRTGSSIIPAATPPVSSSSITPPPAAPLSDVG